MLRNLLCSAAILVLSISLTAAAEIKGRITKVDGQKITVETGKKGETQSKDYDAVKDVAVSKKTEDGKEKVAGGLSAIDTSKKGVNATLVTDDAGKVTEVILGMGKKKKN